MVRYERKHSNSMWHADWNVMKALRMRGLQMITFLNDASRRVTGACLLKEATSENGAAVLRGAIGRFGAPATILSDSGTCFVEIRSKETKGRGSPPCSSRSFWTGESSW